MAVPLISIHILYSRDLILERNLTSVANVAKPLTGSQKHQKITVEKVEKNHNRKKRTNVENVTKPSTRAVTSLNIRESIVERNPTNVISDERHQS